VTRYRTIVADPPWPHEQRYCGGDVRPSLPYPIMTINEIGALPVKRLAQNDVAGNRPDKSVPRDGSILYLWTTTAYLDDAFDICRAWGFTPGPVLVWCKTPTGDGAPGGTFKANVEFVIVGRRGSPQKATSTARTRWFTWPRGRHSEKPEAFFDLVEQVSPGPYLELFARRQRLGWDTWGNEALDHLGGALGGNAEARTAQAVPEPARKSDKGAA
jgi:N6-adenosine-specific RNA methylase IME4